VMWPVKKRGHRRLYLPRFQEGGRRRPAAKRYSTAGLNSSRGLAAAAAGRSSLFSIKYTLGYIMFSMSFLEAHLSGQVASCSAASKANTIHPSHGVHGGLEK
jgi:hypothetical protein